MTEGEWRVGISFNPSNNGDVTAVKALAADLIDTITTLQDTVFDAINDESSNEDFDRAHEQEVLYDRAARLVEEAAMWAVKALTKTNRKRATDAPDHPQRGPVAGDDDEAIEVRDADWDAMWGLPDSPGG